MSQENVSALDLIRPDDWHVHLRDGAMLAAVAHYTARQFARAIVMPNLDPPITTVAAASACREPIVAAVDPRHGFTPLTSAYLTDDSDAAGIARGFARDVFIACELCPAHATTNAAAGVTDIRRIDRVPEQMQAIDMALLVHGEVVDPRVDVFDREAEFIERALIPTLPLHAGEVLSCRLDPL